MDTTDPSPSDSALVVETDIEPEPLFQELESKSTNSLTLTLTDL